MLEPSAFVLCASAPSEFKEVPLSLSGYPKEEAGEPCHYLKRELLPIGETRVHPDDGYKVNVTPDRADKWIRNFELMAKRGHAVPAPPDHKDNKNSFGKWVGFSRETNAKGGNSLFGVLKVVGDRTKEDVLNRDVSIFVTRGLKDDLGNEYDETLTHVAVTPYAALTGLAGWTSIAASRGPAISVPILSMAVPDSRKEIQMDLTKLRDAVAAGKEISDDKMIELAVSKLNETKTIELSRTKATEDLAAIQTKLTAAEAQVVALSRTPTEPDPEVLADRASNYQDKIEISLAKGEMPKAFASKLAAIVKDGDKPNAFVLSRQPGLKDARPIDFILDLFKGEKFGIAAGEVTPIQLNRQVPDQVNFDPKTDRQMAMMQEQTGAAK